MIQKSLSLLLKNDSENNYTSYLENIYLAVKKKQFIVPLKKMEYRQTYKGDTKDINILHLLSLS